MRIKCSIDNFSSYSKLEITDDPKGLVLLHGATGSGKSTMCDAIPWILFGKTAKGGSVDDVLMWGTDNVIRGMGIVDFSDKKITIVRTRGKTAKYNDLYWTREDGRIRRGKDILDTQKLINTEIGLDFDLYLSGAYFHEFSQSAQFFVASAKTRRMLCEQIVDLKMPVNLQIKATEKIKYLTKNKLTIEDSIKILESDLLLLRNILKQEEIKNIKYEQEKALKKSELLKKQQTFDSDKKMKLDKLYKDIDNIKVVSDNYYTSQIAKLKTEMPNQMMICATCGANKYNEARVLVTNDISRLERQKLENELKLSQLTNLRICAANVENSINMYAEQIATLDARPNSHLDSIESLKKDVKKKETALKSRKHESMAINAELQDIEKLSEIICIFRSVLIENAIMHLETKTNELLYKHFDSEIKINLLITDSEKLDVTIMKDGNKCTYPQLSKGQRQLLKLCFGIAMMEAVADHHGLRFSQLFLDEALDGLDETLKIKAYGLLEELSTAYDTIYVVEHNQELKSMFSTKLKVTLNNGISQIEET